MLRKCLAFTIALFLCLAVESAYAHNAQVVNESNAAVRVTITHVSNSRYVWNVGTLNRGQSSRIQDLAHGTRQVIVKSAYTNRIFATAEFVIGNDDDARIITITGDAKNGDVQIHTEFAKSEG